MRAAINFHRIVTPPRAWEDCCSIRFVEILEDIVQKSDISDVVVTFDDGFKSDIDMAMPVLIRLGLTGIFFVPVENIGKDGYVSVNDLRELVAQGFQVGLHGWEHVTWVGKSRSWVLSDIEKSRSWFEANGFKDGGNIISVPYGMLTFANFRDLKAARFQLYSAKLPFILSYWDKHFLFRISYNQGVDKKIAKLYGRRDLFFAIFDFLFWLFSVALKTLLGDSGYKRAREFYRRVL